MFFCIGENGCSPFSIGEGETVEKALSSWSSSGDVWGDILNEVSCYCPVIIQGKTLNIELECPPPIIRIKECFE